MKISSLCLLIIMLLLPNDDCAVAQTDEHTYAQNRIKMVAQQIKGRGITDAKVLAVMQSVPRHDFVPAKIRSRAYFDRPLPIGEGQTISQPYIVALMSESIGLTGKETVLEIGTGSGYQAAILSGLAARVITMEIKPKLFETASQHLKQETYANVSCYFGDGYFGYPQKAPYDAIMITAAVDHIPPDLLKQLKIGGRLILPLGNPFSYQHLVLVTKHAGRYSVEQITGVLFVPMTGHATQVEQK